MKFTWLTYRRALRRARQAEYRAFNDHQMCLRGPDHWLCQMRFTYKLEKRMFRERVK